MKLNKDIVLIQVEPPKEQDESGIFIQEEWITNEPIGVVQEVADNVTFCKPGDKVWFERYTAISYPGRKELKLCREDAVLAVLDA